MDFFKKNHKSVTFNMLMLGSCGSFLVELAKLGFHIMASCSLAFCNVYKSCS
jgi:hypothetical protein